METTLPQPETDTPKIPIYSETAFVIAAIIGGPLAATYMYIYNLKAMDKPVDTRKVWGISIIGFLILIAVAMRIPGGGGPGLAVGLVFAVRGFVQYYHSPAINQYVQAGGTTFSLWRAAGIGALSLSVSAVIILGVAFAMI
jgi:hypothetical protein